MYFYCYVAGFMELLHFCKKNLICKMLSIAFCKEKASLCQIEAQVRKDLKMLHGNNFITYLCKKKRSYADHIHHFWF